MAPSSGSLFDPDVPDGLRHRDDFITREEEAQLVAAVGTIEFATFEMRGVVARRRVAFFGGAYEPEQTPPQPMPDFLVPLRDRLAAWAGLDGPAFAMALVNEYRPGSPIGWHRDAPQYGIVAGVSLLSSCRMKFRPYVPPRGAAKADGRREATHEIVLAPRSAYLMTGASRSAYEHHIPAVTDLRYSLTFRTLR